MRFKEWERFLQPLSNRSALAAFFCSVLFLASAKYPIYGIAFVPVLLLSLYAFPRFPRRASLAVLLFFALRMGTSSWIFAHPSEENPFKTPTENLGFVESVMDREEGVAVIIRSESGRFRLSKKQPPFPSPGDSIRFQAKWFPVEPPTVPGGFDSPKWLRGQGLSGFGKLESFSVLSHRFVFEKFFSGFRHFLKNYFSRYLPAAESGLLIGLLAGDRSQIPDALQNGFKRAGIVHVLAISGFHVVLLSEMILLLLKATRMPHRIARICAILFMLLYAPAAGGSLAVFRAVFMFSVVQIGLLFERKADSLNALGVALVLLCAFNPEVIWNVGFQLSASATAGIIAYGKRNPLILQSEVLRKNKIWICFENYVLSAVWITWVATAFTAPFLIWSFHSLSPISIVGNICVVPLVSLGMQAGLFALLLPIPATASLFCEAAGFLFRLSAFLVAQISSFSIASVTAGPLPAWVLLILGTILLSLGSFKNNSCARRIVLLGILVFGCYFTYQAFLPKARPEWSVAVLDVGQGDCIVVKSPSGNVYLVDAGVNTGKRNVAKDKIIPYLQEEGIWMLKGILITHPDLDHFSGASVLLQEFPVENLWIQECSRFADKPEWKNVLATAQKLGVVIQDLKRGMIFRETFYTSPQKRETWNMRVIHPDPFYCGETNSQSISMRIEGIGGSMLLTGDLTKEGEQTILQTDIPLKSDVLKLGHHGSKTSSSVAFLEAVNPDIAIASNGRKNRFRHPHKEVVNRLDSLKIPLLNTSEKGSVFVRFNANGYQVQTSL